MALALNNMRMLIYHKTKKPNQAKRNSRVPMSLNYILSTMKIDYMSKSVITTESSQPFLLKKIEQYIFSNMKIPLKFYIRLIETTRKRE